MSGALMMVSSAAFAAAGGGGGATLPDTGTRADENPLAAPGWETAAGGVGLRLVGGYFVANASSTASMSRWIGTTIGNDHEAETQLITLGSDSGGPAVRVGNASGSQQGYFLTRQGSTLYLFKRNSSGYAQLGTPTSGLPAHAAGDKYRIRIVGSAITVYYNDTIQTGMSVTDTDIATGLPGMFAYDGTSEHDVFDCRNAP